MRYILILIITFLGVTNLFAKDLNIIRSQVYEYALDENDFYGINGGIITPDNNMILIGAEQLAVNGFYSNILLMKINPFGDTLWTKRIGSILTNDVGINIIKTSDGNFVALCIIQFDGNFARMRLYKLDQYGNIIWNKTYLAETEFTYSRDLVEASDGGLIISGMSDQDIFVFKTGANGDSLWASYFGTDYDDFGDGLVATSDGGAVVAGRVSSAGVKNDSLIAIRVDSLGNQVWSQTFPFNGGNDFWGRIGIVKDNYGDMILAASVDSGYALGLYKFTDYGDTIWSTKISTPIQAMIQGYAPGNDNSIWLTGTLLTNGTIVAHIDTYGDTASIAQIGTSDFTSGTYIRQIANGDIYVGGKYKISNMYFMTLNEMTLSGYADNDPVLPDRANLYQNRPNPFNLSTEIEYSIESHSHVSIFIFNTLGQKVRTLVDQTKPAGVYSIVWNGSNDHGQTVASGVYYYQIVVDNHSQSKKMLLLK